MPDPKDSAAPDRIAADAARAFASALSLRWQDLLGAELLGVYILGSLAHGGFSRRYSDIDIGVIAERPIEPSVLAAMRAAADGVNADLAPRLSIFWSDRGFTAGRFPPLDRLDYLDRPAVLIERERIALPRPTLHEIRSYLTGTPFMNWSKSANTFADASSLAANDRKSYLRAHLYPARFILSFMTGTMASNDDAVASLRPWAPAGLDVDLIERALDIRLAAADPDPLFPSRSALPRQVAACAALVAESREEQP